MLSELLKKMKTGRPKWKKKSGEQWMKIYLAPIEGITGHIYRTAYISALTDSISIILFRLSVRIRRTFQHKKRKM